MKNLNQIDRIKIKLRLAKNVDLFLEVFGSESHKYQLNKPLKSKEVESFENKHNIKLPNSYKTFLTEIGNGGIEYENSVIGNSATGPFYGIFNLGHPYHFITDGKFDYLQKEDFFNSKITEKKWSKFYENIGANISNDELMENAYAGILIIGYCGCSDYLGIMLNGKEKGRVVYTYDEISYCPHFVKQENFLDWYEDWLNNIINGENIGDEEIADMTEGECFERLQSDKEPYWKIVNLAYIRGLENISSQNINVLWIFFRIEKDKMVKNYLFNLLVKFDYNKAKEELFKIYKKKPLFFLNVLHLYAKRKSFEWRDELLYIKQKHSSELEVMEYLEHITENDIKTTI